MSHFMPDFTVCCSLKITLCLSVCYVKLFCPLWTQSILGSLSWPVWLCSSLCFWSKPGLAQTGHASASFRSPTCATVGRLHIHKALDVTRRHLKTVQCHSNKVAGCVCVCSGNYSVQNCLWRISWFIFHESNAETINSFDVPACHT